MGLKFNYPDGATPLDPDEAEGLIPSLSTQAELNEFEALNIIEGALWARKSRRVRQNLVQQETLREIHRRMFGQTWRWAGSFRLTQKSIGCEPYRISSELKILLDDFNCWIEFNTYSDREMVARFHHRLVWVHPFVNGNGRFARFATELLCEQKKWPNPTWGNSNLTTVGEARLNYISSLRAADISDLLPLTAFMFA